MVPIPLNTSRIPVHKNERKKNGDQHSPPWHLQAVRVHALLQEPPLLHLPHHILQFKCPPPSQRQFIEYLWGSKQTVHDGTDRLTRRESSAVEREYPLFGQLLKDGVNVAAPSPWLPRRTSARPSASPRSFSTPPWRAECWRRQRTAR